MSSPSALPLDRIASALRGRLVDAEAAVRDAAAAAQIALEHLDSTREFAALLPAATPAERVAILEGLAARGAATSAVVTAILTQFDHDSPGVRVAALRALARLSPETEAVQAAAISRLSGDQDAPVREAAAIALRLIPAPERVEGLFQSLGDATVRHAALETLDHIGWRAESDTGAAIVAMARRDFAELASLGAAAVPLLVGALRDQDRDDATAGVHNTARQALTLLEWRPVGSRSGPDARGFDRWVLRSEFEPAAHDTPQLEVLIGAIGLEKAELRAAVAEGLGDFDDSRARAALEILARDPADRVRVAAERALKQT